VNGGFESGVLQGQRGVQARYATADDRDPALGHAPSRRGGGKRGGGPAESSCADRSPGDLQEIAAGELRAPALVADLGHWAAQSLSLIEVCEKRLEPAQERATCHDTSS